MWGNRNINGSAHHWRWFLALCFLLYVSVLDARANSTSIPLSKIVEASGTVEWIRSGSIQWTRAKAGDMLYHNDRIRTGKKSRAAIQLSDKSVIRLNQLTTIQVQAPSTSRTKRIFDIKKGSLYFFNREKPADIEFRTPLSSGSIRGTEFVIDVDDETGQSNMTMLDGEVLLKGPQNEISVLSGETAKITPDREILTSKTIETVNILQWSLYYPAVLDPDELNLKDQEKQLLQASIDAYQKGRYLPALERLPDESLLSSDPARIYAAQLWLTIGQVPTSMNLLDTIPTKHPLKDALLELIAAVKFQNLTNPPEPASASQWLARSYDSQSRSELMAARHAALQAVAISPGFGQAQTRLAELEFALGFHQKAMDRLKTAKRISPADPRASALQGFIFLDQNKLQSALTEFERTTQLDAAMAEGWLGQGLSQLILGHTEEGRALLQIAAALEPNRSILRSYLAKAFAEANDQPSANKDFKMAKKLDPQDPTPWLYSALFLQQQNRINEAIRSMETSRELNDNQSLFRSRLRLDQDRATRTANLAALYEETGLTEPAEREAARSVALDYANFSTHHFLANSLANKTSANLIEQRFETTRESERLMANMLSPIGGENLSLQISEQERLRYFALKPFRGTAFTEYRSNGDWTYGGAMYGTFPEAQFSYALDLWRQDWQGWRPNSDLDNQGVSLQLKHQLTSQDALYFQISHQDFESGDLARYYDETDSKKTYRYSEKGDPDIIAGLHHQWSPEHRTLLLAGRMDHEIQVTDQDPNVLFVRKNPGVMITGIETPPLFDLQYQSQYQLYSLELQHIWQTERQALIAGSRFQLGQVDTVAGLNRSLTGSVIQQSVSPAMHRFDTYAYYQWRILDALKLITGLSYEHLQYPVNTDFMPVSDTTSSANLVSPKLGLLYQPGNNTHLRAMYSRSLGGLFFDNSVRLQPTQLAGYNQAYRSLIPESIAGQTAGTRFDVMGVGLDHHWKTGTWFGLSVERMSSEGRRSIGALTHTGVLPIPEVPTSLQEDLEFEENTLALNVQQLCGDLFSVGARWRSSHAELTSRFPTLPVTASGVDLLNRSQSAWLHQAGLFAIMNHPSGFYTQLESNWYRQTNHGDASVLAGDSFFHHNIYLGYHFPRRTAEIRMGLLNVLDQNYHLNPLNYQARLPQERTFTIEFRVRY